MNINKFTIKSQEALQQAQQIAQSFGQQQLENEHIFKAILEVDSTVTPFILKKVNVNIDLFQKVLDSTIQSFPKVSGGEIMLSRDASSTLNEASILAKKMNDDFVSIEHIKPVVLFKHSTRCIISRTVLKQFDADFQFPEEKIDWYLLDLLNHRDLSNEIASRYNVIHQSPQIVVIRNGKAVFDESHDGINAEDLKQFT